MYFASVTFLIGSGWLGCVSDSGKEGGRWAGSLLISMCCLVPKSILGCQVCLLLALCSPSPGEGRDLEYVLRRLCVPCTCFLFLGFLSCYHPGVLLLMSPSRYFPGKTIYVSFQDWPERFSDFLSLIYLFIYLFYVFFFQLYWGIHWQINL